MAVSALAEHADNYIISFYPSGSAQASIQITCKKAMSQDLSAEELKSLNPSIDTSKTYRMYIGEVIKLQMRE